MEFSAFIKKYHQLSHKKYLFNALYSFISAVILIALGAFSGVWILILLGFLGFFMVFGFIIVGAIKSSRTIKVRRDLIIKEAWMPILKSTKPLEGLAIDGLDTDLKIPEFGPLMTELSNSAVQKEVNYVFNYQNLSLYFLYTYHYSATSNGGTSQSVDFKGLYYKHPIDLIGSLEIKKDLPKLLRNVKKALTKEPEDQDGSEKYVIEGTYQKQGLDIIDQIESLEFKDIKLRIKNGLLEIALNQFQPFPKITKNVPETMKLHQDYLLKIKTLFGKFEDIQVLLENERFA